MFTFNCKGKIYSLKQPWVMGIINLTPDSFYSGSRQQSVNAVLQQSEKMINEGADIIDMGGQSTRPGSEQLGVEEELQRVVPAIESLHKNFPDQLISIDSFYARVAIEAVAAGAHIVNDISAGSIDPGLWPAVAALQVPYVLMHMQGTPKAMQQQPHYENVTLEVFDFLNQELYQLHAMGIKDVIIDPGFGFGKSIAHNFSLLKELSFFRQLHAPLMVGLSRKSTIYKTLQIAPGEALNGTTVMHTIALLNGANLLRVHDVKAAKEAIRLVEAYK